jgi:hypothetical protein
MALPIALLVALSACDGTSDGSTAEKAPEFKLPATDGRIVSLSELHGQAVFLNFWDTA